MKKAIFCIIFALMLTLLGVTAFAEDGGYEISATRCGKTTVHLSWDYDGEYDSFELYRNDGTKWKKVKNVYTNEAYNYNLVPDTEYQYRVRACYQGKTGEYSSTVSFSIRSLTAPEKLTVIQSGTNKVLLNWEPVPGAERYLLYRSTDGENWSKIKHVYSNSTENYNLVADNTYYYRIAALDSFTTGVFSDTVSFRLNQAKPAPQNLSVVRRSATSVHLTWDAVEGVDSYILYRSENGAAWKKVKTVTGTETFNYSLSEQIYSYKVSANVLYAECTAPLSVSMIRPQAPEDFTVSFLGNKVYLQWSGVDAADAYSLYRSVDGGSFKKVKNVTENFTYNYNLESGKTYSYYVKAYLACETSGVYSEASEVINVCTSPETTGKYRALLIGETGYVNTLHGPDRDVAVMQNILEKSGYEVCSQTDATKADIAALIEAVFIDATEDDVSLFYYSGHGVTGADDYYSGALQTVDYQYIPTEELAELLRQIPGRVFVILDCCGSGAVIVDSQPPEEILTDGDVFFEISEPETVCEGDEEILAEVIPDDLPQEDLYEPEGWYNFSPEVFNRSVLNAFAMDDSFLSGSRELREGKFSVLTASGYEENSKTIMIDGVWGGLLTRGISAAVGRSFADGSWVVPAPADADADGILTMRDLYNYCVNYTGDSQTVHCYEGHVGTRLFDLTIPKNEGGGK